MEIRQAVAQDVPLIVALLKQSLGESLMPKSEQYWRWKHIENPFGSSPVLVAIEGKAIIGVRAFMRWNWTDTKQNFRAVRAVDTATHPDHQGKGIFKKLTLSLLERCTNEGDHFVFNTPNSQSKPGYLKLGWVEAGKLPVRISVTNGFRMIRQVVTSESPRIPEPQPAVSFLDHTGLQVLLDSCRQQHTRIETAYTPDYLRWRYAAVPVANYITLGETKGNELTGLAVARTKQTRIGRELRITDCFTTGAASQYLKQQISQVAKELHVDYITFAGTTPDGAISKFVPGVGSSLSLSVGPMVTVKALQMKELSQLNNFVNWSPSFGDLELF
jgi:GNAT superfamily N-acetyltransferase